MLLNVLVKTSKNKRKFVTLGKINTLSALDFSGFERCRLSTHNDREWWRKSRRGQVPQPLKSPSAVIIVKALAIELIRSRDAS
jgi:hypothetical protein